MSTHAPPAATAAALAARIPEGGSRDADEILARFLDWVIDTGLTPYPEQEEALLELMLGKHVVLATPTGSGKSLVALGLHFKAMCEGERSFYTAPIKALVSEKFFALCRDFGPENVGMLTGDASINHEAPIICCTTEVLANMALRQGEWTDAPYVVLDEFHYYGDRDRGSAWQIPLIALPHACFLLMSATLGNTAQIEEKLAKRSGREVALVYSELRPVPLDYDYRETSLHETLEDLVERGKAPIYVVHFTQRECGEQAQGLTSAHFCTREERREIAERIAGTRFDTAYGKDLKRFLSAGVGVHHAGLLPRYRLLVEQLAQDGLLKVICGTDTLGVGVNIPIRTVVFSGLSKYDGEKVGLLSVREFKQIAGRAGRKGFDELGSVVCQAPVHVIEKRKAEKKGKAAGKKSARASGKKPPRGFVPWNQDTFQQLIHRMPEPLSSRFDVTHGMVVNVLQRASAGGLGTTLGGGYRALIELIGHSHEGEGAKARLRRRAAALFRSLRAAEIVVVERDGQGERTVRIHADLQENFSLHDTLSLYLVEALGGLDPEADDYALDVLSLVEAIQENPRAILVEQIKKKKGEVIARLKAEGVPYEERMQKLDEVTYDKPNAEFIFATFELFARRHPWVGSESVRPKSIAREMFERCSGFVEYAKDLNIARSEGVLLRDLSQTHNTLVKSVPEAAQTDAVFDVVAYFRTLLRRVDSSLMEAWEDLADPQAAQRREERPTEPDRPFDLVRHPKLLTARIRTELHTILADLARGDFEAAAEALHHEPHDAWDAARLKEALAPYYAEYAAIDTSPAARRAHHTRIRELSRRRWDVSQVIVDPAGDGLWALHGEVDLTQARDPEAPLVRLHRIGI